MNRTQQHSNKVVRGLVRLSLLAAISIIGALILRQLEPHSAEVTIVLIARVLGGAIPAFVFGLIPALLVRNWYGFLVGVLIICLMNYFGAQAILANQAVH